MDAVLQRHDGYIFLVHAKVAKEHKERKEFDAFAPFATSLAFFA